MAKLANSLTGRGSVGWLKNTLPILNNIIWSTRWIVSQGEPYYWLARGTPAVKKEALKAIVGFVGTTIAIESAGDIAGIWDAEADPRSTNFGKIRFKGTSTWVGPPLGEAQILRTVAQVITNQRKDAYGQIIDQPGSQRWDPLGKYAIYKLVPPLAMVEHFKAGRTPSGQRRDITQPGDILAALWDMVSPGLAEQDMISAFQEGDWKDGLIASSALLGESVQTYNTLADIKNTVTKEGDFQNLQGQRVERYIDLNRGQQKKVDEDARVLAEINRIEDANQQDIKETASVRLQVYRESADTEEKDLAQWLTTYPDVPGEVRRKRIQAFKTARYTLGKNILSDPLMAEYTKNKDTKAEDVLAQAYWDADAPDDANGEPDFRARDITRETILKRADELGVKREYITKEYLGKRYKDPVVREAILAYEKDMETIEPYWEIPDKEDASYKPYADISKQAKYLQQRYGAAWEDELDRSEKIIWAAREKSISDARYDLRNNNSVLDRALQYWYNKPPLKAKTYPGMTQPTQPMQLTRPIGR